MYTQHYECGWGSFTFVRERLCFFPPGSSFVKEETRERERIEWSKKLEPRIYVKSMLHIA